MKILTFSTLFPNQAMPQHGIFVAERLKHLRKSGAVEAAVIAPVPWFPAVTSWFPAYSRWKLVPRVETCQGMNVLHPRYPVIPKFGMSVAPALLALWTCAAVRRILARGYDFDLIDAHYFYPDGVSAVLLGRWFNKPVVITGRGTDLSLIPRYRIPRWQIRWAARNAAQLATVSDSLRKTLNDLGVAKSKTRTLRNGVDLDVFVPVLERDQLRTARGITGVSVLMVGNLVELKGHHLVIEALGRLPADVELRIAGDGPLRNQLVGLAGEAGVGDRVHFLGRLNRSELVEAYNAADLLVLASSREGMPNVVLESMACGTPVVATDVGGVREVMDHQVGNIVSTRTPDGLAAGISKLMERSVSRATVRRHAESFSWQTTTAGQLKMFELALRG